MSVQRKKIYHDYISLYHKLEMSSLILIIMYKLIMEIFIQNMDTLLKRVKITNSCGDATSPHATIKFIVFHQMSDYLVGLRETASSK